MKIAGVFIIDKQNKLSYLQIILKLTTALHHRVSFNLYISYSLCIILQQAIYSSILILSYILCI